MYTKVPRHQHLQFVLYIVYHCLFPPIYWNVRWFIGDFTRTPQYFASSLSVNCHDSQFHRLPTMKFASSLLVNCHDSKFHRLSTMKFASSLSVNCHDGRFHRLPTIRWTDVTVYWQTRCKILGSKCKVTYKPS